MADSAESFEQSRQRPQWVGVLNSVVRRVLSALIVLLAASTLVFFGMRLAPGSILDVIAGQASSELVRAEVAAAWGLDRPIWEQYLSYMARLAQGDLGHSYILGQPVLDAILERTPATLALAGLSMVFALAIAFIVIILTGTGVRWAARLSSVVELILVSSPSFWLGILLIFFVSFKLNLLPIVGQNQIAILILPALTLSLKIGGELIQIMRSEIGRVMQQPFAISARARGISDIGFSYRHALRHALLPVVTVAGWIIGSLLTGTFVVEQLFGRTGVGTLTVRAVLSRDTPLVMGVSLAAAAVYVTISAIVDVLQSILDPRLRHHNSQSGR